MYGVYVGTNGRLLLAVFDSLEDASFFVDSMFPSTGYVIRPYG